MLNKENLKDRGSLGQATPGASSPGAVRGGVRVEGAPGAPGQTAQPGAGRTTDRPRAGVPTAPNVNVIQVPPGTPVEQQRFRPGTQSTGRLELRLTPIPKRAEEGRG